HDVVEVGTEGATGELRRLGERAKDRIHAAVVTRKLVAARGMPDGLLIGQLPEGVDIALGEGVEGSADKFLVGVGHGSPSLPSNGQGGSLRPGHPALNDPPVPVAPYLARPGLDEAPQLLVG